MKKLIVNLENPKGNLVDLTAEEISQKEQDAIQGQADAEARENKITENNNLKASAKQKLMNGEPLTEEEADTIVL